MSKEQKTEIFEVEQNEIRKSSISGKLNGRKLGVVGVIVVLLIALVVGIAIYNTPASRLSRQLDLGNRYLEEQNYEQAIVEFDKAIAIDPMSVDAYLGKAQAYERMGDTEKILETLQTGYEKTGDEHIKAQLIDTLRANIPAFDIGDIKIFGYNLLNPHFDEIVGASGYPYPSNYNEQNNYYYSTTKLQNDEGLVDIVDGDTYKVFGLLIPVDGGSVFTISYQEDYSDNAEVPKMIGLFMNKVNGEETETFQLGESWCDIPISLGDDYEKWCNLLGVDLLIESSLAEEEDSSSFDEDLNIGYTNRTYTMAVDDIGDQNNMIVYVEKLYEEDVRDEDIWFRSNYDMYASFEMDVDEENVDHFALRAYFLDGVVQSIGYVCE